MTQTREVNAVRELAHLAHYLSRRAVQELREGNRDAADKYRSDADWYLRWARQRRDWPEDDAA